jgi:hypothetical protein
MTVPWRVACAALTTIVAPCGCAGSSGLDAMRTPKIPASTQASSQAPGPRAPLIYAVNYDTSDITEYPVDASGDVAPMATIAGSKTHLINPLGIALDGAGNIYASNAPYTKAPLPQFAVFAPNASGDARPIRQISARRHGDAVPFGIAVDTAGYLYEADTNALAVKVFAPGARGESAPVRVIAGSRTGIHDPYSVTVDAAGHAFVPDGSDAILEFAAGANGNVAPLAAIRGPHAGLNGPGNVALDALGNIYVSSLTDTVLVFAAGANGDVAPIRTIAQSPRPTYEGSLAVRGAELFVAQSDVGSDDYSIDVYPANASGPTPVLRRIKGPHTLLDGTSMTVH